MKARVNPGSETQAPFIALEWWDYPNAQVHVFWDCTPTDLRQLADELEQIKHRQTPVKAAAEDTA
jgi:hypothetical protein